MVINVVNGSLKFVVAGIKNLVHVIHFYFNSVNFSFSITSVGITLAPTLFKVVFENCFICNWGSFKGTAHVPALFKIIPGGPYVSFKLS